MVEKAGWQQYLGPWWQPENIQGGIPVHNSFYTSPLFIQSRNLASKTSLFSTFRVSLSFSIIFSRNYLTDTPRTMTPGQVYTLHQDQPKQIKWSEVMSQSITNMHLKYNAGTSVMQESLMGNWMDISLANFSSGLIQPFLSFTNQKMLHIKKVKMENETLTAYLELNASKEFKKTVYTDTHYQFSHSYHSLKAGLSLNFYCREPRIFSNGIFHIKAPWHPVLYSRSSPFCFHYDLYKMKVL